MKNFWRLCHTVSFCTENPQVGTFPCWGCTTHLPFSPSGKKWQRGHATRLPFSLKIHKSAPFMLSSCHTPSFFAKNPQVSTFLLWGRATWLPFSLTMHVARGQWYCLKRNPMCIFIPTRHPTPAKSSPTCELLWPWNVSTPNPNCTALAPFSPSLVWLAYDLWRCHGMIKSLIYRVELNIMIVYSSVLGFHFEFALHVSTVQQTTWLCSAQFDYMFW